MRNVEAKCHEREGKVAEMVPTCGYFQRGALNQSAYLHRCKHMLRVRYLRFRMLNHGALQSVSQRHCELRSKQVDVQLKVVSVIKPVEHKGAVPPVISAGQIKRQTPGTDNVHSQHSSRFAPGESRLIPQRQRELHAMQMARHLARIAQTKFERFKVVGVECGHQYSRNLLVVIATFEFLAGASN